MNVQKTEGTHLAIYENLSQSLQPRLTFAMGDISVMDAQLNANPSRYQLRYEFITRCQSIRGTPTRHKSLIYGDVDRMSLLTEQTV